MRAFVLRDGWHTRFKDRSIALPVPCQYRFKNIVFFIGIIVFLHLGRSFEGHGSYQGHFRVISGDEPENAFKTPVRHRKVEIGPVDFNVLSRSCKLMSGAFEGRSGSLQV